MKNAIKYILSRTNIQQKDLAEQAELDKRYVSKVVNRAFAVPVTIVSLITELTGVPESLIVDEKGVCRELNGIEIREIDSYLDSYYFIKHETELRDFPETHKRIRRHNIDSEIAKLQRKIRKDILSVDETIDSELSAMDIQENNISFYKTILEFRYAQPIDGDECHSLFKAFDFLIDGIPEETVKKEIDPLIYGIYIVIKKSREIKATKNQKLIEELEEFFPSILDDFEKE